MAHLRDEPHFVEEIDFAEVATVEVRVCTCTKRPTFTHQGLCPSFRWSVAALSALCGGLSGGTDRSPSKSSSPTLKKGPLPSKRSSCRASIMTTSSASTEPAPSGLFVWSWNSQKEAHFTIVSSQIHTSQVTDKHIEIQNCVPLNQKLLHASLSLHRIF